MRLIISLWFIVLGSMLAASGYSDFPTQNQWVKITSVDGKEIKPDSILRVDKQALVRGAVSDSNLIVFLLAHPLRENNWWVQKPTTPLSKGQWQGIALLGKDNQGVGEFFEIVAIVSLNTKILKEGDKLKSLPDTLARSDIVVVSRGKSPFEILDISRVPAQIPEVGRTVMVKGRVSNPQWSVYVFVHPMTGSNWYVQKLPSPANKDGRWQSICFFGTEIEGVGEFFEVVAVFAEARQLFREGQELDTIPQQYQRSSLFTVRRVH